jgi:DNA polymerase-3 subunit epsilon
MPYLVLDLEMTGPEPDYNEIIQIGAEIYNDNWEKKGEYLSNVYPENEDAFSSHSENIHGILIAELDEAPMMYDVLPEFEAWIRKNLYMKADEPLKKIIICGQSIINDINFLSYAYKKEKLPWPYSYQLLDLHTLSYFAFMILSKNDISTPKGLSLAKVAQYFGFERESETHNALEDAKLTAQCFKAFFEMTDKMVVED